MFFTFWPKQPQNLIQDAIEAQYHLLTIVSPGVRQDFNCPEEEEDPLEGWLLYWSPLRIRDGFVPLFESPPDPKLWQAIDVERVSSPALQFVRAY